MKLYFHPPLRCPVCTYLLAYGYSETRHGHASEGIAHVYCARPECAEHLKPHKFNLPFVEA